MSKNVQIPFDLLLKTVAVMEKINIADFNHCLSNDFHAVLSAFQEKRTRCFQRSYYSTMICDPDGNERDAALFMYRLGKEKLKKT